MHCLVNLGSYECLEPILCKLLVHPGRPVDLCFFHYKLLSPHDICTSCWCGPEYKAIWLTLVVTFSITISSEYLKYIFFIIFNNVISITTSSSQYLLEPNQEYAVCTQNANIFIQLFILTFVHSIWERSNSNLSQTTNSNLSVGTLLNRLAMSLLPIWLLCMEASVVTK